MSYKRDEQSSLYLLYYYTYYYFITFLSKTVILFRRVGLPDAFMFLQRCSCPLPSTLWDVAICSGECLAAALPHPHGQLLQTSLGAALTQLHHTHHSGSHTSNTPRSTPLAPCRLWLPSRPPGGRREYHREVWALNTPCNKPEEQRKVGRLERSAR